MLRESDTLCRTRYSDLPSVGVLKRGDPETEVGGKMLKFEHAETWMSKVQLNLYLILNV